MQRQPRYLIQDFDHQIELYKCISFYIILFWGVRYAFHEYYDVNLIDYKTYVRLSRFLQKCCLSTLGIRLKSPPPVNFKFYITLVISFDSRNVEESNFTYTKKLSDVPCKLSKRWD